MERYIEVQNVSLNYKTGAFRGRSFKELVFSGLNRKKPLSKSLVQDISALKNISISIKDGERVALIGANGSGKSTLLKAITGIYPLSGGKIDVRGKLYPLFELSLGFEHEATGLENIRYRNLLLGYTPKQIQEKTQGIIEFSELGEFIHYPIKTYSMGMLLRLAFSISTAIEGEILLLDEVMSAGDAKFMEKAKKRIYEIIHRSGIIVFASHDFHSIRDICNRAIYLKKGQIIYDGDVDKAIDIYLEKTAASPD